MLHANYLSIPFFLFLSWSLSAATFPDGFVDVQTLSPGIVCELRYLGNDNFIGAPVDGYHANRCILSRPAAEALARVQQALEPYGLGLHVFDAYRPQQAVDHFVRWAGDPQDTRTQEAYYPELDKTELFPKGYIAERSGHSRGSTVDLTIIDLNHAEHSLDMGSPFDFFGPASWPDSMAVDAQARANRLLLRTLMMAEGFKPYAQEWWHFTLSDEPWPDQYFDFPIK